MEIDNKKMWESILKFKMSGDDVNHLIKCNPLQAATYFMGQCFKNALKEQGFEFNGEEIVRAESKHKFNVGDIVRYIAVHPAYGGTYLLGNPNNLEIGYDSDASAYNLKLDNCLIVSDERRKQFMQELAFNGYEWDADKKELKKIESSIPEIVDEHFDEMIDWNCQQQSLTEFEKAVRDVITTELCSNFGDVSFGVSISDMEARLIASKILPAARMQIASEVDKYDMSEKYFRNATERFRFDSYFYEEGILDTLKIIKGE